MDGIGMSMDIALLDIAIDDQLAPKRVAATKGGEYHSPCPGCGGKDRFIIWPESNRYYCRQCGKSGDVIQYYRDFHGCSFKEACKRAHITPKNKKGRRTRQSSFFIPQVASLPPPQWQLPATEFIDTCHDDLINTPNAIALLVKRGFSMDSIKRFRLGWNNRSSFVEWLDEEPKRKIWLPKGIVIPTLKEKKLVKMKIRRSEWYENDVYPKYVEIHGSMSAPSVYATDNNTLAIILESELDAMLIQQEADNMCTAIALGGASKKPDKGTHILLSEAPAILFSLDFDETGIKQLLWWKKQYRKLIVWVTPFEKSVGDAFIKGLDIKSWMRLGIKKALQLKQEDVL
jgi:DNA primase